MKAYLLRWPEEWQLTLIIGRLQLRIGNLQQAIWWQRRGGNFVTLLNAGKRIRVITKR